MPRPLNMRSGYAGAAVMNLRHSDRARATSPLQPSAHESHKPFKKAAIMCYPSMRMRCLCLLSYIHLRDVGDRAGMCRCCSFNGCAKPFGRGVQLACTPTPLPCTRNSSLAGRKAKEWMWQIMAKSGAAGRARRHAQALAHPVPPLRARLRQLDWPGRLRLRPGPHRSPSHGRRGRNAVPQGGGLGVAGALLASWPNARAPRGGLGQLPRRLRGPCRARKCRLTRQRHDDRHILGTCHKRETTWFCMSAEHKYCQRKGLELSRDVSNMEVLHKTKMQGTC